MSMFKMTIGLQIMKVLCQCQEVFRVPRNQCTPCLLFVDRAPVALSNSSCFYFLKNLQKKYTTKMWSSAEGVSVRLLGAITFICQFIIIIFPRNCLANWNIYEPEPHGSHRSHFYNTHTSASTRNHRHSTITTTAPFELDPNPAVARFREYLRLDTSHPNPNYDSSIAWIRRQASEIGLQYRKVDFQPPALFTVVVTWKGSNPNLKSIMLNSHIDVVPADETKWKYDPFAAIKESNGDIYARGAQDRKSLGVQYMEAIRRLKASGFKPLRAVHVTFVPDEELGGARGMGVFVNSAEFKSLNIGMELDEGAATFRDEYPIFYGERSTWQFRVTATGRTSHAALMLEDNAAVKLEKVMRRLLEFREQQRQKLAMNTFLEDGDVTSINLSQLGGGVQANVVPAEMWAIFDMRIKVETNFTYDDAQRMLDNIISDAGPGVRIDFILQSRIFRETQLDDSNIWWTTFKGYFDEMGLRLAPKYFPGATDARFIRNANYSAFGFSPLPRTEPLQHQNNEFLNEKTFLDGIHIYEQIIPRLANVDPSYG